MSMPVNSHFLQHIDWSFFEKKLYSYLLLKSSQQRIEYSMNSDVLNNIFTHTEDFIKYALSGELDFCHDLNITPDTDIQVLLIKVSKEQVLGFKEQNELIKIIEFCLVNKNFFIHSLSYTNEFFQTGYNLKPKHIIPFRRIVNPDGEVNYFGDPELAKLYKETTDLAQEIRRSLNQYMAHAEVKNKLQSSSLDYINGKYIIPIRSDSYNKSIGSIVSRSESGNTLFVEPNFIQKQNIKYRDLSNELDHIIARLELEYSKKLSTSLEFISNCFNLVTEIDLFRMRALFALEYNLAKPNLSSTCSIELKNAFHPLIQNPVKNDIYLKEDKSGLIISGPNTGGKSISLKIIFLTQVLAKLGLFIPCRENQIFLFENLYFFGGDQQSLEGNLSSFAAEVKNYTQLFDKLGNSNLVVIDEIFNTTSSEEASALAMGLFLELKNKANTKVVVSTHHQTLKTFLHQNDSFQSAHVHFDQETLSPTYNLINERPGSSHAIDIFEKLTKETALEQTSNTAKKYLDNSIIHYEKLLSELAYKQQKLDLLLNENEDINKQLKNQKAQSEGLYSLEREKLLEQFKKDSQRFFDSLHNDAKYSSKKINSFESKAKKYIQQNTSSQESKSNESLQSPTQYHVGEYYYSTLLKRDVLLKKLSKKAATVTDKGKNVTCPLDTLKYPKNHKRKIEPQASFHTLSNSNIGIEHNCLGMRLEEFQTKIDLIASHLIAESIPFATIIHGHGTGVLKNYLKEYIKNSPHLKVDFDETGNDGSTRITLK